MMNIDQEMMIMF